MRHTSILLIEDDLILAPLYMHLLSEVGRSKLVSHTTTGAAAISFVHTASRQPDLILTDMVLPDMNGLTLISALQTHTHARIVVLSNLDDSAIRAECLNLGAAGYYIKSELDPEQFLITIQKHIDFLHP